MLQLILRLIPFIGGNRVSVGLLNYLWSCSGNQKNDFLEKYNNLLKENPLSVIPDQLDELIYGKDMDEWNYIANNFDDHNSPLWRERGIFKRLKKISVPTIHGSSMVNDQDGLDALNSFMEIDKTSPYR